MVLGFWLGFSAMLTQILMLRELLVQFSGNELAISIILGSWLFWVAVGNFVVSLYKKELFEKSEIFISAILWLIALVVPLEVFAARIIRLYWAVLPGEIMGADKIFLTSFLLLAPACLLFGGLFVLYIERCLQKQIEQVTGKLYIIEAVGASVGGLFFTFVLVWFFSDSFIAIFVGLVNLGLALFLAYRRIWLCLVGVIVALLCWSGIGYYLHFNPNPDWPGYQIHAKVDTVYSRLIVASRLNDEFSFFSDRHHIVSVPDRLSAEEAVHWAALQHPDLRSVLLIGGIGESVGEILKYPHVEKVSLVELDAGLIDLALKYFPVSVRDNLSDQRVELINSDGRLFVKTTTDRYDLVLLNLPDSSTASLNRFFTVEFFDSVKRLLKPGGILSFGIQGAQNFYRETHLKQINSLQSSLGEVFPQVLVLPGERVIFLASEKTEPFIGDVAGYLSLVEEIGIDTDYVSSAYIPARLDPYRLDNFYQSLTATKDYKLNRDFHPMSYYYNLILWSDYFNEHWGKVLKHLVGINHLWLWGVSGGIFLILFVIRWLGFFPKPYRPAVAIFTAGFAEISSELIIIFCFQIFYGSVYHKIGLILASFMAGLALGGYFILRTDLKEKRRLYYLIIQSLIFIYPVLIIGSLEFMRNFVAISWILPLMTLGLGVLGGLQFPLAVELICYKAKNEKVIGGILNGIDLLGATLGAVFLLSFLVPILGIYPTLLFLGGLNLAAFVFML